jgi:hypothetical protein
MGMVELDIETEQEWDMFCSAVEQLRLAVQAFASAHGGASIELANELVSELEAVIAEDEQEGPFNPVLN